MLVSNATRVEIDGERTDMTMDNGKERREKLSDLLEKRRQSPSYKGNRTGMMGLWSKLEGQKSQENMGTAPWLQRQTPMGPARPILQRIQNDPGLRQKIINFLSNLKGNEADSGETGNNNAVSSENFGLGQMSFMEDLSTSSSLADLESHRRQLESRADWLEATLEETLMELERISLFIKEKEAPETPKTPKKQAPKKKSTGKSTSKKKAGKRQSKKTKMGGSDSSTGKNLKKKTPKAEKEELPPAADK